jgi:hypothetical protein
MSALPGLRFDETWKDQLTLLMSIDSLDLIVLRGHAFIEQALVDFLAVRLGTKTSKLPDLTFARSTALSLSGVSPALFAIVTSFNRVRNYVAHHLNARELDRRLEDLFVRHSELGITWPTADHPHAKRHFLVLLVLVITGTVAGLSRVLLHHRRTNYPGNTASSSDEPTVLRKTCEYVLPAVVMSTLHLEAFHAAREHQPKARQRSQPAWKQPQGRRKK